MKCLLNNLTLLGANLYVVNGSGELEPGLRTRNGNGEGEAEIGTGNANEELEREMQTEPLNMKQHEKSNAKNTRST